MQVVPALDIRGGKCVRLYQGDFNKETVFSEDPVGMALHWQHQGAEWLHVVDLDGAAQGDLHNLHVIDEVLGAVSLRLQVGGGVRRLETMENLIEMGVERVVLGTVAVEEPRTVQEACQRFGDRIVVSIDAVADEVATRGWRQRSRMGPVKLAAVMAGLGVKRFIYTDIARDGTLEGPNFQAMGELVAHTRLPIVAAGGIATLEHLTRLKELGVEAAIVGMALYNGAISFPKALASVSCPTSP